MAHAEFEQKSTLKTVSDWDGLQSAYYDHKALSARLGFGGKESMVATAHPATIADLRHTGRLNDPDFGDPRFNMSLMGIPLVYDYNLPDGQIVLTSVWYRKEDWVKP